MSELKPCPFCGGEASVVFQNPKTLAMPHLPYNIWCSECNAEMVGFETSKEAIQAWNKRVGETNDIVKEGINNAPTINSKRGMWLHKKDCELNVFECSVCGHTHIADFGKNDCYCSCCGADMGGDSK